MTSFIVLLAPFLLAAEPVPKTAETTLDKKALVTVFGGDCRVKWTRSEFLLDVDPNPPGTAGPMKARLRLVLTPFTAKRLRTALSTTIQRHEAMFGVVEAPKSKEPQNEGTLDPGLAVVYVNFCRVTATPEEVFLDFGLSENPFAAGPKVITLERRVILTHLRGKKMLTKLARTLSSYEAEVGVIELDVRKRVKQRSER
jgi:hypothetical protein